MKVKTQKIAAVLMAGVFLLAYPVWAQGAVQALGAIDTSYYTPSGSTEPYPNPQAAGRVRNVILLIGDGMGLSEVTLARLVAGGATGKLYMERFPVTGIVLNDAANALVTESAAAATALAGGMKTQKGMLGLAPEGGRLLNLPEAAQQKGMGTGLVVTGSLSEATPAGFAVHIPDRGEELEIALAMSQSGIDVLLGGGRSCWVPETAAGGERKDGRDLTAELGGRGYGVLRNAEELTAAQGSRLLGLFAEGAMTTLSPEPSLEAMTVKAIETLGKNKKGFFLMAEGSQIDWAGHQNNAEKLVRQVLLFDRAVKAALEFAEKDGATLVIVTADHETGGLVLLDGELSGKAMKVSWATKGHTPTPVMLYAFGPGSPTFTGVQHQEEVSRKIAKVLGITDFPKVSFEAPASGAAVQKAK